MSNASGTISNLIVRDYTKHLKGALVGTPMMIEERTRPVVFYNDAGTYVELDMEVDVFTAAQRSLLESILNNITSNITVTSVMGDTWVCRLISEPEIVQIRAVPLLGEGTPLRNWYRFNFKLLQVA